MSNFGRYQDRSETTITGFKELETALQKLGPMIVGLKGYPKNALRNASRAGAKIAVDAAKAKAPVESGDFKRAIKFKILSLRYRDQATLKGHSQEYYYIGVDLGISRKNTSEGVFYANAVISRTETGNDTTPAKPFLRPAVNGNMMRIESAITTKLRADLIRIAKKIGDENQRDLLMAGRR